MPKSVPQVNYKKDSDGKRGILKEKRTIERKTEQESEETDYKNADIECGAV